MSTGPTSSIIASAAGAPLAQNSGPEVEKTQQEAASRVLKSEMLKEAEKAAAIGETQEEHQSEERDADGRRLWEKGPEGQSQDEQTSEEPPPEDVKSIDPEGLSGQQIDLSG